MTVAHQVRTPPRLGNVLVERGYLTLPQLEDALQLQQQGDKTRLLGEILVDEGFCTEDHVVECLAAEYGVPYAKLEPRLFDAKTLELLPREFVEANLVLPLFCIRDVLTVAVSEPSNLFLIDEVRGAHAARTCRSSPPQPTTSGG